MERRGDTMDSFLNALFPPDVEVGEEASSEPSLTSEDLLPIAQLFSPQRDTSLLNQMQSEAAAVDDCDEETRRIFKRMKKIIETPLIEKYQGLEVMFEMEKMR